MPLMQPSTVILEEAGVIKPTTKNTPAAISEILNSQGLSREDIIESLQSLALYAEKEETRLRAQELALKLHGELRNDSGSNIPNFTFVIQNYNEESNVQVNQILTPRI
jgi:hypothetical protein